MGKVARRNAESERAVLVGGWEGESERARERERERERERAEPVEDFGAFSGCLYKSVAYRSPNETRVPMADLFSLSSCLRAAYTMFCDEDFGRWPSSFQMDVLHHEFSESMFCRHTCSWKMHRNCGGEASAPVKGKRVACVKPAIASAPPSPSTCIGGVRLGKD
jgi:hypothetical protein